MCVPRDLSLSMKEGTMTVIERQIQKVRPGKRAELEVIDKQSHLHENP